MIRLGIANPIRAAAIPALLQLLDLYRRRGSLAYEGEGVTQLTHAWQCGQLARAAGASPELTLAAWLHDIGHLASELPGSPTITGVDDAHEAVGAALIEPLFGAGVARPVALHVHAKRYLVATRPRYARLLSADSVRSLALQGGPMTVDECHRFAALPHCADALKLRTWDERAKRRDWNPRSPGRALEELWRLMLDVYDDDAHRCAAVVPADRAHR
ncbi:MAG: HD domain-containing protein [Lautropia sp.]